MTEIKFCENNFIHGVEEVIEKLKEKYEDIDVQIEPCLGFCGDCANGPYALVNDEMVQADSADELFEAIVEVVG